MEDTIAAISTPYGEGGIGIIRISGEESLNILKKIFRRPGQNQKIMDHMLTYGHILDSSNDKIVDEVLAVYMKEPKTYTGEDIVEINCHGGIVPLRKTLELVYKSGARPAERGEFTQRAFLNGRLDLSQAEAVIDLIKAKADSSFDVAIKQLGGSLSDKITEIRAGLMDVLVDLTVNIDYPDEDIEILTYDKLEKSLETAQNELNKLIDSADTGRIISEGLRISIIGKPNVGKSSIMNSLLRESRAIVTDIPGTTRDIIEERMSISGIPVVLTDTAGIRETDDKIESIGIEKSKQAFNNADLVFFVLDGGRKFDSEDEEILRHIDMSKTIVILNKTDLELRIDEKYIEEITGEAKIIKTSVATGSGINEIEEAVRELVYGGKVSQSESVMVTNARHKNLLLKARKSVNIAIDMVEIKQPFELIEMEVHESFDMLGEIIGETVTDDVLNEVFSRFCLGK